VRTADTGCLPLTAPGPGAGPRFAARPRALGFSRPPAAWNAACTAT